MAVDTKYFLQFMDKLFINTLPYPKVKYTSYRRDIDGLRGLSIFAVLAFHFFPTIITGGYVGVSIFFVISGYLISAIIFKSLDSGAGHFIDFYIRRIRRIFPSLILVLSASFSMGWFVLTPDEYKQLGKYIFGGAVFIDNFIAWNESGYFDNASELKPLLHLWSLGIEEQFYIFWPLLLLVSWKRGFNLITITVLTTLASFLLNLKGINHAPTITFYSPLTRVWEILSGGILAYVHIYQHKKISAVPDIISRVFGKFDFSNTTSLVGAVFILFAVFSFTKQTSYPGIVALIPVLGTILIISAGGSAWVNRILLSNSLIVWFGLISYPLYLWHWTLLSFLRVIEGEEPRISLKIFIIFLSVALSYVTYKFIENPIRFGAHSRKK